MESGRNWVYINELSVRTIIRQYESTKIINAYTQIASALQTITQVHNFNIHHLGVF